MNPLTICIRKITVDWSRAPLQDTENESTSLVNSKPIVNLSMPPPKD